MKARPRKAENMIAQQMTQFCNRVDVPFQFERIPVIGRTGPDLTFPNPLGLAIDVKSRRECPKTVFDTVNAQPADLHHFPGRLRFGARPFVAARIDHLEAMLDESSTIHYHDGGSQLISGYLEHMAEWTGANEGVPAIVIHRPRMRYSHAVLTMLDTDWIEWFPF